MHEVLADPGAALEQVVDRRPDEGHPGPVLEAVRDQLADGLQRRARVLAASVLDEPVQGAVRRLVARAQQELAAGACVVTSASAEMPSRSCSPGTLKSITSVPK